MHQINPSTIVVNLDTEKDEGDTRVFLPTYIMANSDDNTKGEVYDAAYSIINKIEDIQNETRDLLTMIGDLPTNGEPLSGDANLPRQWGKAAGIKLLSSVEFPDGSIANTGSGPWEEEQIDSLIQGLNYKIYEPQDSVLSIVLGYEDAKIDKIRKHIKISENPIKIYPQELFISYLFTGIDPLPLLSKEQVQHWIEFHPALNELFGKGDFPWPLKSKNKKPINLDAEPIISLGLNQSPINMMGYTVQAEVLTESHRRGILVKSYIGAIPTVLPIKGVNIKAYMDQWGHPHTHRRLWRIAKHLEWLCNGPRTPGNWKNAKVLWKRDLKFLYDNFYGKGEDGDSRFTWPG